MVRADGAGVGAHGGSWCIVIVRDARPTDAAAIARIHVETWGTAYRGIVPDAFLASLSVEARAARWSRILTEPEGHELVRVAEDEAGDLVGFASAGPERTGELGYEGELYALYVRAEHQRRGVGRALTLSVVEGLAEAGLRSMLLWVLAENPARGFYEAIGGTPVATREIEIEGAVLDEIAYGWEDTTELATHLRGADQ